MLKLLKKSIFILLVVVIAGLAVSCIVMLGNRAIVQDENTCTNECDYYECDYKDEYLEDLQFNIYYIGLFGVANSDDNLLTFTAATPTFYVHAPLDRRQGHYIFAYWEWYVLDCVCNEHVCSEYCDEYYCGECDSAIYYNVYYECYCYGLRRERVDTIPQGTARHLRLYARWIRHTRIYWIVSSMDEYGGIITGAFDVFVVDFYRENYGYNSFYLKKLNDRRIIHIVVQYVNFQDAFYAINLDSDEQAVTIIFG